MSHIMPTKFNASGADLMMTGARYIGIVGPVAPWTEEQVRRALQMLANAGTGTRISLRPQESSRGWEVQSTIGEDTVRTIPGTITLDEFARTVEEVRRTSNAKSSFQVVLCGDYVLIDTSHELGDGKLFVDLVSAIGEIISTGELPIWARTPETRHPLLKAIWHWFGRHPKHVVDTVRARIALQRMADPASNEISMSSSELTAWEPSYALEIARSTESIEAGVTKWRKTHAPQSSSATVAVALLRRAFAAVGLNSSPELLIAVNCRRYLPPKSTVNGNFIVGLSVPYSGFGSIDDNGALLNAAYESGLPLAWLSVASSAVRISKPKPHTMPTTVSATPRMQLMYSDLGRPRNFSEASWFGKENFMFTGLLDPAGPDAVTVMSGSVGGERTLSASFHDNVFARAAVKKALHMVTTDPLSLLEP